ncbi:Peptidyl-prolyl cis-trans isomerase fpr2 [Cystobasidiomycetes sp. EMM_F5]
MRLRLLHLLSLPALLASAALAAGDLQVRVDELPSECPIKTQNGDKLQMHYTGWLQNADGSAGNKFDSSRDRGQTFGFKLGGGQVIAGWDRGLVDMCIGEKRTLTIPPELGYGNRNMGPIPAGSTLIFDVELVEITVRTDITSLSAIPLTPPHQNRKAPDSADQAAKQPSAKTLVDQAIKANHIVIFSKSYCPHSKRAKDLIASIPDKRSQPKIFELDLLDNGADIQAYLAELTGQRTVPSIFIGNKHVGGSDRVHELHEQGELVKLLIGWVILSFPIHLLEPSSVLLAYHSFMQELVWWSS